MLPGMEGNSDGIASALQQMEERSERRASTADAWISSVPVVRHWTGQALATTPKAAVINPPANGETRTRTGAPRSFRCAVEPLEPAWNPCKKQIPGFRVQLEPSNPGHE